MQALERPLPWAAVWMTIDELMLKTIYWSHILGPSSRPMQTPHPKAAASGIWVTLQLFVYLAQEALTEP